MAYETKVLLISLAQAARSLKHKDMYELISEMANAEGVILKPYEETKSE